VRHGRGDHTGRHVKHAGGEFTIGDGTPGALTMKLREQLVGIQRAPTPTPSTGC